MHVLQIQRIAKFSCCLFDLCNEPNTLHPGATERPRPLYPLPTNPPLEGLATVLILKRKYKKDMMRPPLRVPSLFVASFCLVFGVVVEEEE